MKTCQKKNLKMTQRKPTVRRSGNVVCSCSSTQESPETNIIFFFSKYIWQSAVRSKSWSQNLSSEKKKKKERKNQIFSTYDPGKNPSRPPVVLPVHHPDSSEEKKNYRGNQVFSVRKDTLFGNQYLVILFGRKDIYVFGKSNFGKS